MVSWRQRTPSTSSWAHGCEQNDAAFRGEGPCSCSAVSCDEGARAFECDTKGPDGKVRAACRVPCKLKAKGMVCQCASEVQCYSLPWSALFFRRASAKQAGPLHVSRFRGTTPNPLPFCPFALRFKLHRPAYAATPGGASPGVSQSRSTAGSSAGSGSGSGLAASAAMVAKIAAARELARRLTEERQAAIASATVSSLEDVSRGLSIGMQGCACVELGTR